MLAPSRYTRSPVTTMLHVILLTMICATSACNADEKAEKLLQNAAQSLGSKKYTEAIKMAKEAAALAADSPAIQQRAGEILFLSGDAEASLPCFDRANKLHPPLAAQNWQRGVALGCIGKFAEGAEQFRIHHEVNPNDVENSAWYFLCLAKSKGKEAAQSTIIPSQGDSRQPMMSVLKMLQGTLKPDEVLAAAKANTNEGPERKLAMFYGFLYVGLYYDSIGESEKAVSALDQSIAVAEQDYMGRTAQIYRDLRFPKSPKGPGQSPTGK